MANIKFSDFTANGNIDGGSVPSPSGSETSFLVGFDSTAPTNNKWTLDQVAAGLPTLYAGDGSINEDRVITVGHDSTTKASYTTTFESAKTTAAGSSNTRNTALGNRLILTETVTLAPTGYSSSYGAGISLTHNSTGDDVTGTINVQSVNSGGSDWYGRSQMGFRTNTGFVFAQNGTAPSGWNGDAFIVRDRLASNQSKSLRYHPSQSDGGRLKLLAPNGNTSQILLATNLSNSFYRYISGDNNGDLTLGRKLSGGSEEAYITCSGVGGYTGSIAVGVNQSTPTETLHVTGNTRIEGQAYTDLHTGVTPLDPDWNNGNVQESTLTSGSSDFDPSNPKAGATYILKLTQPASGAAGTVNWDNIGAANIKWPGGTEPTLTATNGAVDIITLICTDSTGQGVYYANATLDLA